MTGGQSLGPGPGQNPFQGGNFTLPPGPNDGASGAAGGSGGGGKSGDGAGVQCTPNPVQIYPKGEGLEKVLEAPGEVVREGKAEGRPEEGGGSEYISVLPTQEAVQAVADFGEVIRRQFKAAAGALSGG